MKNGLCIVAFGALVFMVPRAAADVVSVCSAPTGGISCTGTFGTPEDAFTKTFTLSGNSNVTVQTYSFGGGMNAAGDKISPGGFDPLVALFSGPANNATVLLDGMGMPSPAPIR